jgi:hypothetical protein
MNIEIHYLTAYGTVVVTPKNHYYPCQGDLIEFEEVNYQITSAKIVMAKDGATTFCYFATPQ